MINLNNSGVVFMDNPHSYHLGDKELKGVTGILSKHLFSDKYFGVSDEVLQKAAERGSRIHENCRAYDLLGVEASEEAKAYAQIKRDNHIETIANEYTVTDYENVASNIDLVAHVEGDADNEITIIDFKTTSHLDIEYLSWQMSIYKYLFEKVNPLLAVKRIAGIWLPLSKYGTPRIQEIEQKPMSEVKRLLEADAKGEIYTLPPTVIPPSVLMLQERCYDTLLRLKEAEEESKKLHEALYAAMSQYNIKKWDTENFSCTLKTPSVQNRFDSKTFGAEHPDLYKQYIKTVEVKGSVMVKVKN